MSVNTTEPDVTAMFVLHDAFRRDLRRFAEAVEVAPATDGERARVLLEHWRFFLGQLHHHHTGEDDFLWPMLRERAVGQEDVIDQMEVQHAGIDVAVQRATEHFEKFAAGGDPLAKEWLIDVLRRAAEVLQEHLKAEEDFAMPLVRKYLSAEDWAAFSAYQMQRMSPQELAESMPWILDEQPASRVEGFLGEIPPEARQVYEQAWLPAYQGRMTVVWGFPAAD